MKRATIKDVAKAAGVSIATVSYAIHGNVELPETTRKRVWDAANELGYRPSHHARSLRSGEMEKRVSTHLLIRIENQGAPQVLGDTPDAKCAQIFDILANRRGYFTTTYRYYQKVGFQCPLILDGLIDGAVLSTPHPEVAKAINAKVPAVLVDAGMKPEYDRIPVVNVDIQTSAGKMFAGLGAFHRKAVLVTPPPEALANNHWKMLSDAAQAEGIRTEMMLFPLDFKSHEEEMRKIALEIARKVREEEITLILSQDMPYANSLYEMLPELGISIPEDVSLLTIDSILDTSHMEITRISYDWEKLFSAALDVLLPMLAGNESSCCSYFVQALIHPGKTLKNR